MENWKLALVVSGTTLLGVVVGAQCFSTHPASAQQAPGGAYRECFFAEQETVDTNGDGVVAPPGRNRMISVPGGFDVISGGGGVHNGTILFCRR